MSKTVDDYIQETRGLIGSENRAITPTTAFLEYGAGAMAGEGFVFLDDFGYLVAWVRYHLVEEDFEARIKGWKYGEEELRHRRAAAEAGLDALLDIFVHYGYQPEMGPRLLEIGDDYFHTYELLYAYNLPNDLDALLNRTGNPLKDRDAQDVHEPDEITAEDIGFDLNNPDHRAKWLNLMELNGM